MRAVEVSDFGGPEVLKEVEVPEPRVGPGQVMVDVEIAEVLFLDTQLRAGWGREFFALQPPFVPGAGVAGTIRSVGDGVDGGIVGRRIVAGTGGVGTYLGGGYAQTAVVPAEEVLDVPAEVALATALAALHDGATALEQLDRAEVRPGERVLVNGASGSLGHWLVPLLAEAGATVIAGARGAEKLEYALGLGAHDVVDYSRPGWAERVAEVDVVFDAAGGEIGRTAFDLIARGGRFLGYGAASGDFADVTPDLAAERGITLAGIDHPDQADWQQYPARALAALAAGIARPVVGQEFALADAATAHRAIEERRTTGKTVLTTAP